jgi:hypothetical protein
MRIDRFGLYYESAYQFPQSGMIDGISITRPAVYARVGGLPGAFDYYGDDGFPFAPLTLSKQITLVDNTYLAMDTLLGAVRAATIDIAESKLWLLRRDGNKRWAWAKCTKFSAPDNAMGYSILKVTLEFFCREGAWYAPVS